MDYPFDDIKIEAILEDELYTNPPLMSVAVATLTGTKQDIPRVFRLTKDIASVASLKHLRRVRDTETGEIECIICALEDETESKSSTELKVLEDKFASDNILKNFRVALVPRESPRTHHQLKACQDLWPCKFAKSNYLIRCIEGSVFDSAERLVIELLVKRLLRTIESANGHDTSCAVIFRCNRVYGTGLTSQTLLRHNPMKHSAMLAIDSVACNAGSGHWRSQSEQEVSLQAALQQDLDSRSELVDHKIEEGFLPYLCTNYDVLLTEEPCMMCAMALVQSRIRRLFYITTNDESRETTCYPDGAIEKFMVHRDKSLNHRFEAWRIVIIKA